MAMTMSPAATAQMQGPPAPPAPKSAADEAARKAKELVDPIARKLLAGEIQVPKDFDRMGEKAIAALFGMDT